MENEIVKWLSSWMQTYRNGFWEHDNGVQIFTIDNPGWYIIIDLDETALETVVIEEKNDLGEDDWYFYHIKEGKFEGGGDLSKLEYLLLSFKRIVEKHASDEDSI